MQKFMHFREKQKIDLKFKIRRLCSQPSNCMLGIARIRTFPFSFNSASCSVACDQVWAGWLQPKAQAEESTNITKVIPDPFTQDLEKKAGGLQPFWAKAGLPFQSAFIKQLIHTRSEDSSYSACAFVACVVSVNQALESPSSKLTVLVTRTRFIESKLKHFNNS